MPKKQKHNAFFFFMQDKQREVERREGRTVTMAEMPMFITHEWKMLPEGKKEKYKKMENQLRESAEKLDCRGVPIREIEAQRAQLKRQENEMRKEIKETIDTLRHGNALDQQEFFLVCTNAFVWTEVYQFIPAEVAILKFSLKDGISKEYHVIFPPNNIPKGYGYEANVHSEKTHKLTDENNPKNTAFTEEEVGWSIINFIREAGNVEEYQNFPALYTLEEQVDQTINIFKRLIPDELRIYSLDELFQNLYNAVYEDEGFYIPKTTSNEKLTNCGLDFHPTIACDWHIKYQSDAGMYCALGCVRRWVFHICDNLMLGTKFGIQIVEGKHLPRAQINKGTVMNTPQHNLQDNFMSNSSRDVSPTPNIQDFHPVRKGKKSKNNSRDVSEASSKENLDPIGPRLNLQDNCMSRNSSRDVNQTSSIPNLHPLRQDNYKSNNSRDVNQASGLEDLDSIRQAINEVKRSPVSTASAWGTSVASVASKKTAVSTASAWGTSVASVTSKKTASYGTAAGAVANIIPDTDCNDEFPVLGGRPGRGHNKNRRGKF